VLTIEVEGVARPSGGRRVLHVLTGRAELGSYTAPDGARVTIAAPIPSGESAVRIAIDIDGDIDPRKYGFTAPVQRAGIILRGVALTAE
jgi:hypothetical protein